MEEPKTSHRVAGECRGLGDVKMASKFMKEHDITDMYSLKQEIKDIIVQFEGRFGHILRKYRKKWVKQTIMLTTRRPPLDIAKIIKRLANNWVTRIILSILMFASAWMLFKYIYALHDIFRRQMLHLD